MKYKLLAREKKGSECDLPYHQALHPRKFVQSIFVQAP